MNKTSSRHGTINGKTFRVYEIAPKGIVVGGVLAFHSTNGFPYDITLDIFREAVDSGRKVLLMPLDLMYEMCALGLYDIGEEVGRRTWGSDWKDVYARMHRWAAEHWTCAAGDEDVRWSNMLTSMRGYLSDRLNLADKALAGHQAAISSMSFERPNHE